MAIPTFTHSFTHTCLFHILFPYRSSQNIEQSSLCSIVALLLICFIQSSVYVLIPTS